MLYILIDWFYKHPTIHPPALKSDIFVDSVFPLIFSDTSFSHEFLLILASESPSKYFFLSIFIIEFLLKL